MTVVFVEWQITFTNDIHMIISSNGTRQHYLFFYRKRNKIHLIHLPVVREIRLDNGWTSIEWCQSIVNIVSFGLSLWISGIVFSTEVLSSFSRWHPSSISTLANYIIEYLVVVSLSRITFVDNQLHLDEIWSIFIEWHMKNDQSVRVSRSLEKSFSIFNLSKRRNSLAITTNSSRLGCIIFLLDASVLLFGKRQARIERKETNLEDVCVLSVQFD